MMQTFSKWFILLYLHVIYVWCHIGHWSYCAVNEWSLNNENCLYDLLHYASCVYIHVLSCKCP